VYSARFFASEIIRRISLNPEHPDRYDGADNSQAADGPARDIGRATRIGPVDHGVVPLVVHMSLLKSSASLSVRCWRATKGSCADPVNRGRFQPKNNSENARRSTGAFLLPCSRLF